MNSKKVTVIILFIITIILGGITLYLGYNLSKKKTTQVTPTPTIFISPSQSISRTPTPTPTLKPAVACGSTCTDSSCQAGSTCIAVNASKRCVLDVCINKTTSPLTLNNLCNNDLCTIKSSLSIAKEASFACSANGTKINIVITLINKGQSDLTNIKLIEKLANEFDVKYITNNKISNSGKLTGKDIEWTDLSIKANNGKVELTYEAIVPTSENGKSYISTISAHQNTSTLETITHTMKIEIIPCTDLDGNQIVFIVGGSVLIFIGIIFIKKNYDEKIGQLLWNLGLENLYINILSKFKGNKNLKFETNIIKDKDE